MRTADVESHQAMIDGTTLGSPQTQTGSQLHTDPTFHKIPKSHRNRSLIARIIRSRLINSINDVIGGRIDLIDGEFIRRIGESNDDGLYAQLRVHDPAFYRQVALSGDLGFAESYLQHLWSTDNLTCLLQILTRNMQRVASADRGWFPLCRLIASLKHGLARNTRKNARRNIASHYDLSNDFFAAFLDHTMMYSSAMFEDPEMTLEQASIAKLDAICRQLDLQPSDHVVEIGTGWGGFAIHASRNFGCHVTTTTISQQQFELASRKVDQAGVSDRVTLLLSDYRDLSGWYDKLVSIEMLEAVGYQYFDKYFGKCNSLLKPGGRMVLQTITIPEQRYDDYRRSVDFIQKYIFPGGCLPSVAAIQEAVGRSTDLRLESLADFGLCYARTLREWRDRFFLAVDRVRQLGFDDRFVRMWEYYLCYCEAAFLERAVGVSQLAWIKPSGRSIH